MGNDLMDQLVEAELYAQDRNDLQDGHDERVFVGSGDEETWP